MRPRDGDGKETMVQVIMDDGSAVELSDGDAGVIFDQLWLLTGRRGAISAAGKIKHASNVRATRERVARLDEHESAAFRAARL
jgi:hypothetical protein